MSEFEPIDNRNVLATEVQKVAIRHIVTLADELGEDPFDDLSDNFFVGDEKTLDTLTYFGAVELIREWNRKASSMRKYIVMVREVHVQPVEVFAQSPDHAINKVRDGEGDTLFELLEYSHTMDFDTWTVEEST